MYLAYHAEVCDEGLGRPEAVAPVAHDLGFVVQPFDRRVGNWQTYVGEDRILMASEHPGELPHGRESAVGRPPEPAGEKPLGPSLGLVGPEIPKDLLEHVRPDYFQVERQHLAQASGLLVREVPRVLEEEVPGSGDQARMRGLLLPRLFPSDQIDGLVQVPDDVKPQSSDSVIFDLDKTHKRPINTG